MSREMEDSCNNCKCRVEGYGYDYGCEEYPEIDIDEHCEDGTMPTLCDGFARKE